MLAFMDCYMYVEVDYRRETLSEDWHAGINKATGDCLMTSSSYSGAPLFGAGP